MTIQGYWEEEKLDLQRCELKLKSYPDKAREWDKGVYYPRTALLEAMDDSLKEKYIKEKDNGVLEVTSKMWTETEVTGFGIYPYVNSPVFIYKTGKRDIKWTITFCNYSKEMIYVNCYADEVLKIKDLEVGEGKSLEVSFINCGLYDNTTLQFFASDSAEDEDKAVSKVLYISSIDYQVLKGADKNKGFYEREETPTIFLASDSTLQTYEDFYYPQTGWGQVFHKFVEPGEPLCDYQSKDHIYPQCHVYEKTSIKVENRSIGARSSRSFIDEGKWDVLLQRAKKGDYVLIQWAHNDATAVRPNRYVCPEDFDEFLMKYIDSSRVRGIYPVLVTPVSRRNCDDHDGEFVMSFGEYRDVMLSVAKREHVPCVDLCSMSYEYLKSIGPEEAKSIYLWCPKGAYPDSAYADGVSDNTHLQEYGALVYARMVAGALLSMEGYPEIDSLKKYLDTTYVPQKKEIKVAEKPVDTEVPSGFALQELQIKDKVAEFLLIWNSVEGAVSYNVYRKGSVDFQFFPLRSVSALEKMEAAVLPFSLPAADVYRVQVTAVFEDGRESSPSRTIEFRT